jgi:FkbM family methyltransferase
MTRYQLESKFIYRPYQELLKWYLRIAKRGVISFRWKGVALFKFDSEQVIAMSQFSTMGTEPNQELAAFLDQATDKYCLLDIGALYGVFSLAFCAGHCEKKAYAIDPSAKSQQQLARNLELNPGLQVLPYAIAMGNDAVDLQMHKEGNHYVAAQAGSIAANRVEQWTMDKFVATYSIEPDIIKIDVEGFEWQVLQGGASFLRTNSPVICLEIHAQRLRNYGSSVAQLVELLTGFGYQLTQLDGTPVDLAAPDFLEKDSRVICKKQYQSPVNQLAGICS